MKTIIHVNRHVIARNRKTGERNPCLTVKTYKSNVYAQEVEIKGPCKVVYSPDEPLGCGATVYIECSCEVEVKNAESGGLRKKQTKKRIGACPLQ